ncbi:hypothetical protein EKO27_g3740 [Xylaria grammica]|uniref:Uncharacterized protein n=1 Tax=Xylaria grammica TaxID=363999 RepID=A0A439DAD5_9PEZI|nr:hypothetical protein EKO27_g3740 [Xylaria grammica]
MDNEDIEAMAGPSRSPNLAQTISGGLDQAQPTRATPKESSSITSESSGDETDVFDDSEEEEQADDPPLRPGRNVTTMGFEFELLIAIWIDVEDSTDADFQWWDSLEYQNPNQNDQLSNWKGNWLWNSDESEDVNVARGVNELFGARYTKWSCTDDISIKSVMPIYTDYVIPEGSIPTEPDTQRPVGYPPDLYRWFGAELVSSVLDYDNPQTQLTLRTACAAIRDAMRVHKPMAIIGSGVHIHIGQQAGWTLLHLKKLVTLWHLVEPSIFRLHRRDREQSEWCTPMTDCDLARLVFNRQNRYSAVGANMMGPNKALYENYMNEYIPDFRAHQALFEFLSHIWMYDSIDSLVRGLRADASCISWRVGGNKLSDAPGLRLQTLEFRLMQGTLDAEHIWKWAGVLERLVIFSRDSTAAVFRNALAVVMAGTIPDEVGLNKDDLSWFASRQTDDGYFAYPEGGAINWSDPFMVRGYGDTHNPPN